MRTCVHACVHCVSYVLCVMCKLCYVLCSVCDTIVVITLLGAVTAPASTTPYTPPPIGSTVGLTCSLVWSGNAYEMDPMDPQLPHIDMYLGSTILNTTNVRHIYNQVDANGFATDAVRKTTFSSCLL